MGQTSKGNWLQKKLQKKGIRFGEATADGEANLALVRAGPSMFQPRFLPPRRTDEDTTKGFVLVTARAPSPYRGMATCSAQ